MWILFLVLFYLLIIDLFWFYFLLHSLAVNVGEDCPVFDGLFEFCQLSAGGSVGKITNAVLSLNLLLI